MPSHLYIHVPFCDGKCHYCGFYSIVAGSSVTTLYRDMPARELKLLQAAHPALLKSCVKTVYIGGGTPAMLGAEGLLRLADTLAKRLSFDAVEEWTVELSPNTVTADILKALAAIGVNRLSVGVQSFDNETLARIGRRHSAEDARRAIRMAQEMGFANIGIDLIAGLPGVSASNWQVTLDQAATLNLKHLSVYALSVEPGTTLAKQAAAGLALPGDDEQLGALSQAEECLGRAGFMRYEISNYAQPGYECRHNLGVWRGNDYIGLGPAAASRYGCARWTNSEDVSEYIEALQQNDNPPRTSEQLTETDDAVERALYALRLSEGIDPHEDARRFPALHSGASAWEQRLAELAHHGIVERGGRRWRLTARGREVCDAVLRELI